MASELRVNKINSRTGFGTITVSETGQDLVGVTTIQNLTTENTLVGAAASFTGNVQVGGVLTYEDVTNIDSVGLITARQGIEVGARPGVAASISVDGNMIVSGISTFGGDIKTSGSNIVLGDSGGASDDRIKLGASGDLEIYHSGSHSHITDAGTGGLKIRGSQVIIDDAAGDVMIQADQDGSVDLYHNGTKRIETTAAGVTVTGTVTDSKGNVRSIPLNSQSGAYTLVAADAGKVVYISTGGVTIPSSVMSAGDAVTIINDSGSNQTLTQGSGLSLYNTADATTGNRTLAGRGMATIYFPATATAYISGAGLS